MFERLGDDARRVVVSSEQEARLLNHGYVGTEHLLLGLLNDEEGPAAEALRSLELTLEDARSSVRDLAPAGERTVHGPLSFTPRVDQVFRIAYREARELGHVDIGPQHLLLALVDEGGEGLAAHILATQGASLGLVRRQLRLALSGAGGP